MRNEELRRYSRHILLKEIGKEGQERLSEGRVLLIGCGGLGTPVAMYLAAAGVGTIGLMDGDVVDESNLQRQVIHFTGDVGKLKVASAAEKLRAAEHGGQQEAGGAGGQRLPSFQFYGKLSTLQGLSTSRSFFLIVAERRQKARRKSAVK